MPRPGIELTHLSLEAQSLNQWTPREVPGAHAFEEISKYSSYMKLTNTVFMENNGTIPSKTVGSELDGLILNPCNFVPGWDIKNILCFQHHT